VHFPHSLGIFYETITHFLGFKRYGDEYKVMGLAPYGQRRFTKEMERLVRLDSGGMFSLDLEYFLHHKGSSTVKWEDCEPVTDDYFEDKLADLLGPPRKPGESLTQRHKDIAHSAQWMYEQAFFHLLRHTYDFCTVDAVVVSGGCAFNSVANGKIRKNTPFKKTFIQAAAGDAGGALGAALYVWHAECGAKRSFHMEHAYWGPGYSDDEIVAILEQRGSELTDTGCSHVRLDTNALYRRVAVAIAAGQVVGWFQGRMEWGPRALGNRSILGDPRRADMREILNGKIKRRESFRPFAPAILRESVLDWFEVDDDVPFMMKVLPVRVERRHEIPAVTHVDGSARLQTVEKHQNSRFYRLIEEFNAITGVPILLNTSFNENEPIVRSVDEALDCFLRTGMDVLVVGDHLVSRSDRLVKTTLTANQRELEQSFDGRT
jgi:carbamoyltransferase